MAHPIKRPNERRQSMATVKIMPVLLHGDDPLPRVKPYYKHEMAAMYKVSGRTLGKWLARYLPEMEALGYSKHDKILRPEVVRFIFERLDWP